ncbi:MAG: gamma-glutamyl-gamma-aminobutyrate hydrolase family protein [Planctomycetes bacterium]|nr:gamma-glutamyl-gamma-aminobutyrate hydrolase family protein [Planctomycetota bacterium]
MRCGRPAIGINCDYDGEKPRVFLRIGYIDAVRGAGGLPLLLAPADRAAEIDALLDRVDGLLLSGGDDYAPRRYGAARIHPKVKLVHPRRERFDIAIARRAIRRGLPILGICGGAQLLAIACGGSLRQHLASHPARGAHHAIDVDPSTRLAAIAGRKRVRVNTYHHQAIRTAGNGLEIVARADDGVVEAIEAREGFRIGVQWHPELEPASRLSRALFGALIEEARR